MIVSFFDPQTGNWERIPETTINFVPLAIEAQSVGGFSAKNLLRVEENGEPQETQVTFTPVEANELLNLVQGQSDLYMRSGSGAVATLPSFSGLPSQLKPGSIWFDNGDIKFYDGAETKTIVTGLGSSGSPPIGAAGGDLTGSYPNPELVKLHLTGGTAIKITYDEKGRVTGTAALEEDDLPPIDWSKIKNKPTTLGDYGITLNSGQIFVGNSSGVATARMPGGDLIMDNSGVFTVARIRGSAISAATPADGQILKYVGGGTNAWVPTNFSIGDLKTAGGVPQFAQATCDSHQTLTWNSLTDAFTCTDISGLNASAITSGTLNIARIPTGTTAGTVALGNDSRIVNAVQRTGDTMTGTLNLPSDGLVVGGSQLIVSGGNVGVGTPLPGAKIEVQQPIDNINGGLKITNAAGDHSVHLWTEGNVARLNSYANGAGDLAINSGGGNVGIGVINPAHKLDISSSGSTSMRVNSAAGSQGYILYSVEGVPKAYVGVANNGGILAGIGNGEFAIAAQATKVHLSSNGSPHLTVATNGDVGVGTTTPTAKLDVAGAVKFGNTAASCNSSTEGQQRYNSISKKWSTVTELSGSSSEQDQVEVECLPERSALSRKRHVPRDGFRLTVRPFLERLMLIFLQRFQPCTVRVTVQQRLTCLIIEAISFVAGRKDQTLIPIGPLVQIGETVQ